MKKILLFSITLITAIIFSSCGDSSKDESDNLGKESTSEFQKRYGIKSGVIEYILTGSQEGTKTLYFDSWGMRQAEYTRSVLSVGGFTKSLNLVNIIDGADIFPGLWITSTVCLVFGNLKQPSAIFSLLFRTGSLECGDYRRAFYLWRC